MVTNTLKVLPSGTALTMIAMLQMPGMASAADAGASLFTGSFKQEFGYSVGVHADAVATTPDSVVKTLDRAYKPFTQLTLYVSHPSATVHLLRARAQMRSATGCRKELESLRERLQSVFDLALQQESSTATHVYVGYYGTRDGVVRRVSCSDAMLEVSVEMQGYDSGCDPGGVPSLPADAAARLAAAVKTRFADAKPWNGPEVRRTLGMIGARAENAFGDVRRNLPCLQGHILFYAAIDPAGKVQAVETAATSGMDAALLQRVAVIVQEASFAAADDPATRLVSAALRFEQR